MSARGIARLRDDLEAAGLQGRTDPEALRRMIVRDDHSQSLGDGVLLRRLQRRLRHFDHYLRAGAGTRRDLDRPPDRLDPLLHGYQTEPTLLRSFLIRIETGAVVGDPEPQPISVLEL